MIDGSGSDFRFLLADATPVGAEGAGDGSEFARAKSRPPDVIRDAKAALRALELPAREVEARVGAVLSAGFLTRSQPSSWSRCCAD